MGPADLSAASHVYTHAIPVHCRREPFVTAEVGADDARDMLEP